MTRIKTSRITKKKRKKTLKKAKGFFGSQSKLTRMAKQRVMTSLLYSFCDRRKNKNTIRKIWINRINGGLKTQLGIKHKYNIFINYLKKTKIPLNKKVLSHVNVKDKNSFYYLSKPSLNNNGEKNELHR